MFTNYNVNPLDKYVGDCVIRAISLATGQSWYKTYIEICIQGLIMADMPSSNMVWGEYLKSKGFEYEAIPNFCPECYTIAEFCKENKKGEYVLATGKHVVYVKDGEYYDNWDSGSKVPIYCWRKIVNE